MLSLIDLQRTSNFGQGSWSDMVTMPLRPVTVFLAGFETEGRNLCILNLTRSTDQSPTLKVNRKQIYHQHFKLTPLNLGVKMTAHIRVFRIYLI